MQIIATDLHELQCQQLLDLCANKIPESLHLEYKREPFDTKDKGKHRLLAEVCALANSGGGLLIFGIEEDSANAAKNLTHVQNATQYEQHVSNVCADNIEPAIKRLDTRIMQVDGKDILLVKVPDEPGGPRCYRAANKYIRFMDRRGTLPREMSHSDIQLSFSRDQLFSELATIKSLVTPQSNTISPNKDGSDLSRITNADQLRSKIENEHLPFLEDQPCLRLSATPTKLDITMPVRDHLEEVTKLLQMGIRMKQINWTFGPGTHEYGVAADRICFGRLSYRKIDLILNGHIDFWVSGGMGGLIDSAKYGDSSETIVNGNAMVYLLESFCFALPRIYQTMSIFDDLEIAAAMYNCDGLKLPPGTPGSIGYRMAFSSSKIVQMGVCHTSSIHIGPMRRKQDELPGDLGFRIARDIYSKFGLHGKDQIPYYDSDGQLAVK